MLLGPKQGCAVQMIAVAWIPRMQEKLEYVQWLKQRL